MIKSEATNDERRRALRFRCNIPAKVTKLDGLQNFAERVKIIDFSQSGFRLNVNFVAPNPGARIELKIYLHKNQYNTNLIGEIVWRKYVDNELVIGVKTLQIEKRAMGDILSWVLARSIEKENRKKEIHCNVHYNGTGSTAQPPSN